MFSYAGLVAALCFGTLAIMDIYNGDYRIASLEILLVVMNIANYAK
jgi:hypothetical protein